MAVDFFGLEWDFAGDLEIFEVFGFDLIGGVPLGFFLAVVVFLAFAMGFGRTLGVFRGLVLGAAPTRIFPMGLAFVLPLRGFLLLVASFLFAGFCFFKAFNGKLLRGPRDHYPSVAEYEVVISYEVRFES